ncbi:relaxase/mobilization nuclease domain-containing protein [Pedobacter jejuensis]|uniref:Mobilization protein n=1 Tax=Pedobacter jejuensis TaxID=1268550 RepID=A0A3N0BVT0_9SPHI|nr:relaxase/mobilization nuclease domain-containing protein [Pedobacter jejuensis]RNL53039.1 mobilization protein [Pedobacter jejuensis]
MIGKITSGRNFAGCVRYVVQKDTARVLEGLGIRTTDVTRMIADFNFQRLANPKLTKAVGHISLNFSEQDKEKLTDEKMLYMAREYLDRIGIKDTQVLFVRHEDKSHPHVHLVYNRVSNSGKTISDKNLFQKNAKVCREMTKLHGLFFASGKEHVNRKALTGADKIKYQIFDQIKLAKGIAGNWKKFEQALKKQGIDIIYKYKANTQMIQGISFSKDGCVFKGSEIDRSLSYGKLNSEFELKTLKQSYYPESPSEHSVIQKLINDVPFENTGDSVLGVLLQPGFPASSEEPEPYIKRKKKSQGKDKSQGMSR